MTFLGLGLSALQRYQGVAAGYLWLDNFVDPDGTRLTVHTPDIGVPYTGYEYIIGNWTIQGNTAKPAGTTSNNQMIMSPSLGLGDGASLVATAIVDPGDNLSGAGVCVRKLWQVMGRRRSTNTDFLTIYRNNVTQAAAAATELGDAPWTVVADVVGNHLYASVNGGAAACDFLMTSETDQDSVGPTALKSSSSSYIGSVSQLTVTV